MGLKERLQNQMAQKLGGINPPKPTIQDGVAQCNQCEQLFDSAVIEEHEDLCAAEKVYLKKEEPEKKKGEQICDKCGAGPFIRMGKHKCKIEQQLEITVGGRDINKLSPLGNKFILKENRVEQVDTTTVQDHSLKLSIPFQYTLFIDCFPVSNIIEVYTYYLHEFIEECIRTVCEREGVFHWGLIDFGKGPYFLSQEVNKFLQELPNEDSSIPVYILASSTDKEFQAIQGVLKDYAQLVVKGV